MKDSLRYIIKNPILLIVIIPAFILTLINTIFDGQMGCVQDNCGFIVGTNFRDGIWFQAVAATAFKTFPFQMPNYAGEALRGYHYLPNLFAYILSLAGIPIAITFYKLLPMAYMTGMTILAIKLARAIQDKVLFVGLFLFSLFFGMHLSLVTSLYHYGEIRNGALINTFQATRILESPHVALALLGLFYVVWKLYTKRLSQRDYILNAVIIFVILGTKFYVAFSLILILSIYELVVFVQSKKPLPFLKHGLLYLVSAMCAIFIFYDPFSVSKSGSIFVFSPFATVHHLIETPDLFYSQSMVLARYFLYEAGWSPRLVLIELFSVFLFVVYYFGTRVLSFLYFLNPRNLKALKPIEIAIGISTLISILVSVLFIQKGDWYNPIQFSVPAAYLSVIFLSRWLYDLVKYNRFIGYGIIGIYVLVTLPAHFINLKYLNNSARLVIPQDEVSALAFLKKQPPGVVFSPIDIFDMAYVSAFTGKSSYLNFTNTLENSGIDYSQRKTNASRFPETISQIEAKYFYLTNISLKNHPPFQCEKYDLITLFINSTVHICEK